MLILLLACDPCEPRSLKPACPCYTSAYELRSYATCRQDQTLSVVGAHGTVVASTSGALSDVEIDGDTVVILCTCTTP